MSYKIQIYFEFYPILLALVFCFNGKNKLLGSLDSNLCCPQRKNVNGRIFIYCFRKKIYLKKSDVVSLL